MDVSEDEFAAELARLKRRGSAVLVSDAGDGVGICVDLLGSDEASRRRVLARSADSAVLPIPPERGSIVDATPNDVRSASARAPTLDRSTAFDRDAVARRVDQAEDVGAVASAVAAEVERATVAGVEPGELRVCLGRLDPYLARDPVDRVVEAVGGVVDLVRGHAGMGHAHLAAAPPEALLDVFDVTVETRTTADGLHRQQRWCLHDAGLDTGWL